jgi:hypothetical protein
VPWEKERKKAAGTPVPKNEDLRYYSRGLFCSPIITHLQGLRGKHYSVLQNIEGTVWGLGSVFISFMDWPLRYLTGSLLFSKTMPVKSSAASYNKKIAKELWDVSADIVKLPREPQV